MTCIEYYMCSLCDTLWYQRYDTEDYNNDCTVCPCCSEADFMEISEEQYFYEKTPLP